MPIKKQNYIRHIHAVSKKGVSCKKQGVSWTKIAFLFKCFKFCCLLLYLVQKVKFLYSDNVKTILRCLFFGKSGHAQKSRFWRFFSEKKLHTTLRSVQFLASFICFYSEILSYLACSER